jgi:hypothetical protein
VGFKDPPKLAPSTVLIIIKDEPRLGRPVGTTHYPTPVVSQTVIGLNAV